jgi:hypothetical protein
MKDTFGGADLSMFAGALVAGVIYYPWAKSVKSRARVGRATPEPEMARVS